MQRQGHAVQGRLVHRAVELVGPGRKGEQALHAGLDLQRCAAGAGKGRQALHQACLAGLQVFGQVVQHLGTTVGALALPGHSGAGGLDGVADVFAVAFGHQAQQRFA